MKIIINCSPKYSSIEPEVKCTHTQKKKKRNDMMLKRDPGEVDFTYPGIKIESGLL